MGTDDLLTLFLDALADRIAARIGTAHASETYDSSHLPPRCSRRRFAEVCRSGRVANAQRDGRDWTCSRAAWQEARQRTLVREATAGPPALGSLREEADRLLAKSGLRVVGGRGP